MKKANLIEDGTTDECIDIVSGCFHDCAYVTLGKLQQSMSRRPTDDIKEDREYGQFNSAKHVCDFGGGRLHGCQIDSGLRFLQTYLSGGSDNSPNGVQCGQRRMGFEA
jgi:hypothetical protein